MQDCFVCFYLSVKITSVLEQYSSADLEGPSDMQS